MVDLSNVTLWGARVVKQLGDNSCLFHSLSYCLSYDDIVESVHNCTSGFLLREQICFYIRDNADTVISIAPEEQRSLSEAVGMDGHTVSSYCSKMLNTMEWGGVLEIATAAEMFLIGIRVYVPALESSGFCLLGCYRCFGFGSDSQEISLLYSGFNHYDSLVDCVSGGNIVELSSNNSCLSELGRQILVYNGSIILPGRHPQKSKKAGFPVRPSRKRVLSANSTNGVDSVSSSLLRTRHVELLPEFGCSIESVVLTYDQRVAFTHNNRRERIKKWRAKRKGVTGIARVPSNSASDAALYSKNFDALTHFFVCGICGLEGPIVGCKSVCDMQSYISLSGLKEKFAALTSISTSSTIYDKYFIAELLLVFEDGLIKGCSNICAVCCRELKGKKVVTNDDCEVTHSDSNHERKNLNEDFLGNVACSSSTMTENISTGGGHVYKGGTGGCHIPKFALFAGLFAGSVPDELVGLTMVEESMINIYSSVTKLFLAGGKHFKIKGGTSYTIINDLSQVAKFLPRMPSIEDTAIMRHKNTVVGKDYKYRPFRVFSALNWLKKYNHLYVDIELIWPVDVKYWNDTSTFVDIPYIDITDEESVDIDNDGSSVDVELEELTTNPGMLLFVFMA